MLHVPIYFLMLWTAVENFSAQTATLISCSVADNASIHIQVPNVGCHVIIFIFWLIIINHDIKNKAK